MPKFHVRCGSLQVTILADDPHDAAVELLQRWGAESWGSDGEALCRGDLEEQILVRQPGDAAAERFATFHLLARLRRQTPEAAWRRVMRKFDPNAN